MSRQDLRALFGLDGPRLLSCYDPRNRRTREFADAFLELPDGSDIRRIPLPLENVEAQRFRLYGEMDLAALRREIDGPYREVHDELAAIPQYGYNDSAFDWKHTQAGAEYAVRNLWSTAWQCHYATALVIHFYRRITPQEYQSPAHMRLVYAVGTAVDWITTITIVMDDWMDGARVRNGQPTWHLQHPRSFANDNFILATQALNVLSAVVPDHHPFKREMHDRTVRQIAHDAHYWGYHTLLDLRRAQATVGGVARSPVPVADITLEAHQPVVFNRATDWLHWAISMARLLACYGSGIPDGGAFLDYIAGATTAACVVDDIVDAVTDDDIRNGEPTIQLCLAAHKATGGLGPIAAETAADILDTLQNHAGVDTAADIELVRRMYARNGIPELTLDYLEALLDRLVQLRQAALHECSAPGDIAAFLLYWLAIDRDAERAGETGGLLKQERFGDLIAQLAHAGEDQVAPARS
ncbi:polyprenyl synthetase family protein [Streptomyces natalensis]|uniref:polyprenyl synthetase family protein n=1 Tax=Streptomyces natalensis TaxID=68242 RepID=UPI000AAF4C88|nr:polyprenyl synthetase family protein [Streptomyces natalensis]